MDRPFLSLLHIYRCFLHIDPRHATDTCVDTRRTKNSALTHSVTCICTVSLCRHMCRQRVQPTWVLELFEELAPPTVDLRLYLKNGAIAKQAAHYQNHKDRLDFVEKLSFSQSEFDWQTITSFHRHSLLIYLHEGNRQMNHLVLCYMNDSYRLGFNVQLSLWTFFG